MSSPVECVVLPRLDPADRDEIRALVERATAHDAVAPISEHQLLRLGSDNPDGQWQHLLARRGDALAGYAIVDTGGEPEGELVVDPEMRRAGVGTALLEQIDRVTAAASVVQIWAHGNLEAAQAFAQRAGATPERTLWQLRRPLDAPLPPVSLPEQLTLRTFDITRDEQAWVELNAAAFADHPEQGSWTISDLRDREREDWFDADGFLIAEAAAPYGDLRPGELAGFHWTKVHGPTTAQLAQDRSLASEALGEVYVVGVNPRAQGGGLGKALTVAGLAHLRAKGIPTVLLYVDDDNAPAMSLYRRLGFTEHAVDVQYRYSPSSRR